MKVTELTYQQSNFLALMNGYTGSGGVLDLYAKAMDSAGTAEKKFQLYQQGTEAQLARLKDSWDAMWMSAFKSNDLQMLIGGLSGLVTGLNKVVSSVGALPVILATAGTAIIAFNGGFKTITATGTAMITMLKALPSGFNSVAASEAATTLKTTALTGATDLLSASLNGLKIAGTFALGAIMPMLAFAAVGVVIEKVTQAISDYNQQQAEMKQKQDDLRQSYSSNADAIDKLASKYESLSAQVQNGQIDKSNQDYVDTMNKLGSLMPSLVQSTDAQGNKVLIAANYTKQELEYAKQLKSTYDTMNVQTMADDIKKQADQVDQLLAKIQAAKNTADDPNAYRPNRFGATTEKKDVGTQFQDNTNLLALQEQLNQTMQSGTSLINEKTTALMDVNKVTDHLSQSQKDLINQYIKEASANTDSIKSGKDFTKFLEDTTNQAFALSKILAILPNNISSMFKADDLLGMNKNQAEALRQVGLAVKDGGNDWDSYTKLLTKAKIPPQEITDILNNLKQATDGNASSTADYNAQMQQLIDTEMKKATAEEQLVGTTQGMLDQTKDLIVQYEMLSGLENLSAEQKQMLADATGKLAALYPSLVKNGQLNIEAIKEQTDAEGYLLKAVNDVKDGTANAEEEITAKLMLETKNRIKALSDELTAEQALMDAIAARATADGSVTAAQLYSYNNASAKIDSLKKQIDDLNATYGNQGQELKNIQNEMSSSSKSTQSNTGLTDKYTNALNNLNEQITKLQNAQKQYAQGSASYQKALQQEIDLQQQKLKLMQDQEKSLEAQIKSGNVTNVPVSGVSSGSKSSVSGAYSSTINSAASAYGVDPSIIKAIAMQESGLGQASSNVMQVNGYNGKGATASINAGTKMFSDLLQKTGGDIVLALAAYNMGEGVLSWFKSHGGYSVANMQSFSDYQKQKYGYSVYGDPNYVQHVLRYYNNGIPTSSSSGSSVSSAQSSVNQLQQSLIQLKQDISNQQSTLTDLQYQNIMQKVHSYDAAIATSEEKVKSMDRTSAAYRAELNNQYNLMMQQSKAYDSAAGKIIASEGKDSAHLQQLEADYTALHEKIAALNWEYYASEIDQYTASIDNLKSQIDLSQKTMQLYSGNMQVQKDQTVNQIELNNQIIAQLDAQKAVMERALANGYLDTAQKADMTKQLEALNAQYIDYQMNIKSATDALNQQIQAQQQNINSATDQMIQAYKDAYEEKRKIALAELDQEYSDLEKATQKKLALIDQTENQNQYKSDLATKQSDIATLQAQINAFSLDPTQAGKVADMRKQLAQQQLDLQNYIHQHDVQAQKDALNQQLSDQKDAIDNQKNQVNAYYDDLVNDEQKFALWRKEMLAGNTTDVLNQLGTVKDWIMTNMPQIGQVIATNLTMEIDKAAQAIKDAGTAAQSLKLGYNMSPMDIAQLKLASLKNTSKVDHVTILQDTPVMVKNADGTFEYTGRILPKGMVYDAYGVDYADGLYMVGGGGYVTADPTKTKYQYFDTGGVTHGEGLAVLHDKEIVLNKMDTSNFLKAIDITRAIANMLPKFDIPKLASATNNQNVTFNMPITIQSLTGGKEGADSLFKEINTRLRGKGGTLRFD